MISVAYLRVFRAWYVWLNHTQTTELVCYRLRRVSHHRQWVVSRTSTIIFSLFSIKVFSLYLALVTSLVQWKTLIPFGSPQREWWRPFSEVSTAVTSNYVGINYVWKSLETSCVVVSKVRRRVINVFVYNAKLFMASSNAFVSSAKIVDP